MKSNMASPTSTQEAQEQLRQHFEVERELATRLRDSTREERVTLVSELYSELYKRVPQHPRTLRTGDKEASLRSVASQLRLLKPFLIPGVSLAEFGAGSGALAKSVARDFPVSRVVALEVCEQTGADVDLPEKFRWQHYDGLSAPLNQQSIDVAFSYQVLEHMHPDDVPVHLSEVARILKDNGVYVLSTPHEASGPHDVSRYFGLQLQTFHLREWSYRAIEKALFEAGFKKVQLYWRGKVRTSHGFIHSLILALESFLALLPRAATVHLARKCLNNVILVAHKESSAK
ncbi:MAG: methyltransferase domain-containing protein [Prosthecobacter sp.]